jgi:hypothetical protein
MCLLLVGLCSEDEVAGYDRELVKDEKVAWVCGWDVGDEQGGRRVFERIDLLFGSAVIALWCGFLCEGGTVTELELNSM